MNSFPQILQGRDGDKTVIPQSSTPEEDQINTAEKGFDLDNFKDRFPVDRGVKSVTDTLSKVKKKSNRKKKKRKKSTSKKHRQYKYNRLLHDHYTNQNEEPLTENQGEPNTNDIMRRFFPGLLLGTFLGSMVTNFFLETTSK